ncbi:unnamed protein product [Ostreobium quekettii]|uniref:Uncharacterized protein n=1 Tax=Ostreobium quekettii TaxID=121088 RepID=A0A8S1ISM9_9CHLO|nr:unnamed protein product [Ostreobium quekettii]
MCEYLAQAPKDVRGFVDVKDVIQRFLEEVAGTGILEYPSMLKKMRALEDRGATFSRKTIKALNLTGGDGCFFHTGQHEVTLYELAIDHLLKPNTKYERHMEENHLLHVRAIP